MRATPIWYMLHRLFKHEILVRITIPISRHHKFSDKIGEVTLGITL